MALKKEPFSPTGVLETFRSFDVAPTIGTEFPDASLKAWYEDPNADDLLRDLAITGQLLDMRHPHLVADGKASQSLIVELVSRRGVVFFRQQDDLTEDIQKSIVQRLGILTGKPATSSLHRHAVQPNRDADPELLHINSEENKKILAGTTFDPAGPARQSCRGLWHNDISYEPSPSDYALLRLTQVPKSGGGR
ncbi:taurine catabolism dioxygenase [Lizonia empirigonia]|nr:taurine catabolism dioxygenase [Lizonia empirigonia]